MDPLQTSIKDMEVVRKLHVDKSVDHKRSLQDAYAGLRRAKEDYDSLQSQANEAQQNHTRARMTQGVKDKEIEKLANRAVVAADKADAANEALQVFGEICKDSQEQYYGQMLPALFVDIKKREHERSRVVKKVLVDTVHLDKTCRVANVTAIDPFAERLASVSVLDDIEEFADTHMVDEPGAQGRNVSVAVLLNPVMAGRMLVKRGDFVAGWKTRYFVLMDDGLLYCFDNEAAVKPREVVSLPHSAVHHLDNSYFTRPHCLQIISLTQKGRQTYNLIAESAVSKAGWMRMLRRFASCCIKGVIAREQTGLHPLAIEEDEHDFTVVRSFSLAVTEAKDLKASHGLAALNPYCIALLDDVKQARSTTKNGDAPFWGDEFDFPNICEHYSRLRLVVFNHSRLQRDTDLGYVSINLNTTRPSVKIEQWFPIKQLPRPNHADGTAKGAIRVAYSLNVQELLPSDCYGSFVAMVTEPSLTCIKVLGAVCGTQREAIAKVFVSVLMSRRMELECLKTLLGDEIRVTENPNIIFRGNSMATKCLDQYMKVIGANYLADTIGLLVQQVYFAKDFCEVDPSRVEQPDVLARNWKRLKTLVEGFWDAISKSVTSCPSELKEVFAFIKECVTEKWNAENPSETNQPVQYAAISGFLFLRFFCPAILHPKLFNLIPEHPDSGTSRTFTLVAKILQNLANLSDFGSKEPYMSDCNGFITSNVGNMKVFIDGIATRNPSPPPAEPSGSARNSCELIPMPRRDVEALYLFFAANLDAITEHTAESSMVSDLVRECRTLQNMHADFRSSGAMRGGSVSSFTSEECLAGLSNRGDGPRKLTSGMASVVGAGGIGASHTVSQMSIASGGQSFRQKDHPAISLSDFSDPDPAPHLRLKGSPSYSASSPKGGSLDDLHAILESMGDLTGYNSPTGTISRRQSETGTTSPVPPERKGSRVPPVDNRLEGPTIGTSASFDRQPPMDPSDRNGFSYTSYPSSTSVRHQQHARKKSATGGKSFIKALMTAGGGGGGGSSAPGSGTSIVELGDRRRYGSSSSVNSSTSGDSTYQPPQPQSLVSRRQSEDDRRRSSRLSIDAGGGGGGQLSPAPPASPIIMEHSNESIEGSVPTQGQSSLTPQFRGGSLGSLRAPSVEMTRNGTGLLIPGQYPMPPPIPDEAGSDGAGGEGGSPTDSAAVRANRLRSMSMGSKVKNRLSVIWKNGTPGQR
ncbi:Ras GTPase-activating protein 1 [Thoreauomyces humboldtii]|nr:Ras GTPase-activating protein 1 [Thoreauomyces humboldtii]